MIPTLSASADQTAIPPAPGKPWRVIALVVICVAGLWLFFRLPLAPMPQSAINAMILRFFPPYVLTLVRLLRSKTVKSGLALGLSFGALAGFVALLLSAVAVSNRAMRLAAYFLFMGILQVALILTSVKSYRGLPREPNDSTVLLRNILGSGAYMLFAFCIIMAAPNLASGKD